MVAALVYTFRDLTFAKAEDIVQEAFARALEHWQKKGVPHNTSAWIYTVCRNLALNQVKAESKYTKDILPDAVPTTETALAESALYDQQLKLLFACAHPDLPPKAQVAITLKYVVNLKVEAIAHVMALTVDGVDKMLARARKKIESESILLSLPHDAALSQRLPVVHKVTYLLFNEGYKPSAAREAVRDDLCEEALILIRALIDSGLHNAETHALYALMLFHAARLQARFSTDGTLLDLETQDRARWNADLIRLGTHHLNLSKSDVLLPLHIEAYIAYNHCVAHSYVDTDWLLISRLYALLLKDGPNPFVQLNYAIALYFAGDGAKAFELLNELERHPYMKHYHLLNATIGRLLVREGHTDLGSKYLRKALAQAKADAERKFIGSILNKLEGRSC